MPTLLVGPLAGPIYRWNARTESRDLRAGNPRAHPLARLPRPARLLWLGPLSLQRDNERRLARNGRCRRPAGLGTARQQAPRMGSRRPFPRPLPPGFIAPSLPTATDRCKSQAPFKKSREPDYGTGLPIRVARTQQFEYGSGNAACVSTGYSAVENLATCGFKMTLTYSSATRPKFLFALANELANVICICWSRLLCGSL